ncbi:MAG: 3-deoxy-7-phosphoheptulonate synthase, partial [Duodenibacillus sp.]|nr:3-deoxy-7-phosphoheptulonate synthase [Duodenibacillus sp.]
MAKHAAKKPAAPAADIPAARENVNVEEFLPMLSPAEVIGRVPATEQATSTVAWGREVVRRILDGRDGRLLVIAGPCSIHDPEAAMDYARRLGKLAGKVAETMALVMRVYFEKPRTVTGWKGFVNDPDMDGSFKIGEGMVRARRLMRDINALGVPVATEALDPFSPQYFGDMVSWYAIGARTSESQTHREMASGLSAPVGFKNTTDGGVEASINAIRAANGRHIYY